MNLREYQARLRHVVSDATPDEGEIPALGAEAWRWHIYRRLVRSRLNETLDHCFWRLIELIGVERFRRLVGRFLEELSPRSPYLRDLPGEFLWWLESAWPSVRVDEELPACALDLARFDWAELDTAYTPDEPQDVIDLTMDRPAAMSPAHRLLRLYHAVHLYVPGAAEPPPVGPVALCLYRDPRTHDVHTLELTSITASLLLEMSCSARPLADVIRTVAASHGATIDAVFLDALSTVLADFVARGLLLGSLRSPHEQPAAGQ